MSVSDATGLRVPERRPWLLELSALFLLFVDMFLSAAVQSRKVKSFAELMGGIFAPAIIALVVIVVAKLVNRGITRRGQAKVAVVTLAVVMLGQCGQLGQVARESVAETPATLAARFAAEGAKAVPKRVDDETELISVAAQDTTLVYSYRMVNTKASDTNPVAVDEFKAALIKNQCGNAMARAQMLKRGLTLRHSYFSSDKVLVASVDITEGTCAGVVK